MEKISAKKMAQKVSSLLKTQNPNYDYLRDVFRFVRENLNIQVTTTPKRVPYVPTEDEIRLFYKTVCESNDIIPMLIVKVLLYTGIRVSELVNTYNPERSKGSPESDTVVFVEGGAFTSFRMADV